MGCVALGLLHANFYLSVQWPCRCPVVPQREKHKEFDFGRRSRRPRRCPVVSAPLSRKGKNKRNLTLASKADGPAVVRLSRKQLEKKQPEQKQLEQKQPKQNS